MFSSAAGRLSLGWLLAALFVVFWTFYRVWHLPGGQSSTEQHLRDYGNAARLAPIAMSILLVVHASGTLRRATSGWDRVIRTCCLSGGVMWAGSFVWMWTSWRQAGSGPRALAIVALCLCLAGAALWYAHEARARGEEGQPPLLDVREVYSSLLALRTSGEGRFAVVLAPMALVGWIYSLILRWTGWTGLLGLRDGMEKDLFELVSRSVGALAVLLASVHFVNRERRR
ncbi:hypothetical protein [Streptomyces sp. NBC_00658]|uniref:hypothetical protein n=1 Tax=Streptomyces sp. NBC_00658 TaxID=2975800 RepID=UPI00324D1233